MPSITVLGISLHQINLSPFILFNDLGRRELYWMEGLGYRTDVTFLTFVFQMEPLWAGGLEEPMKHTLTGEVLCLMLKNVLVD